MIRKSSGPLPSTPFQNSQWIQQKLSSVKMPHSASQQIPTHFSAAKHKERKEGGGSKWWITALPIAAAWVCFWVSAQDFSWSYPILFLKYFRGTSGKVGHPLSFDRAALWHQTTLQEFSLGHLQMCHTVNHDLEATLWCFVFFFLLVQQRMVQRSFKNQTILGPTTQL